MHDFAFTLRLDSPLLQSGALSKEIDPARTLRGPSIRGLLHTFARAALGPLLSDDPKNTHSPNPARVFEAELELLGGAAGHGEARFRLDVMPATLKVDTFANRPGGQKGERRGHPVDSQNIVVTFRPRPSAFSHAEGKGPDGDRSLYPDALCAVAWLAFAFGSLGNRARRGYGSLTIADLADTPPGLDLPSWPQPPLDAATLGADLGKGLLAARLALAGWLHQQEERKRKDWNISTPSAAPVSRQPSPFFMLSNPRQVAIGRRFESWASAMGALMDACSDQTAREPALFARTVGSAGRPRLSSPLWCRLYRIGLGTAVVPVATFSPVDADTRLVDQIVDAISENGQARWLN